MNEVGKTSLRLSQEVTTKAGGGGGGGGNNAEREKRPTTRWKWSEIRSVIAREVAVDRKVETKKGRKGISRRRAPPLTDPPTTYQ